MQGDVRGDLISFLQCNGPTCIAQLCQKDALLSAERLRPLKWRAFVTQQVPEVEVFEQPGQPIVLKLRDAGAALNLTRFIPMFRYINEALGVDIATSCWLLETYVADPTRVVRYAWVGDAALSAFVAARLCARHPSATIGELTEMRKRYTANEHLASVLGGTELSCVPKQGQSTGHREGTFVEALLERTLQFESYCLWIEKLL